MKKVFLLILSTLLILQMNLTMFAATVESNCKVSVNAMYFVSDSKEIPLDYFLVYNENQTKKTKLGLYLNLDETNCKVASHKSTLSHVESVKLSIGEENTANAKYEKVGNTLIFNQYGNAVVTVKLITKNAELHQHDFKVYVTDNQFDNHLNIVADSITGTTNYVVDLRGNRNATKNIFFESNENYQYEIEEVKLNDTSNSEYLNFAIDESEQFITLSGNRPTEKAEIQAEAIIKVREISGGKESYVKKPFSVNLLSDSICNATISELGVSEETIKSPPNGEITSSQNRTEIKLIPTFTVDNTSCTVFEHKVPIDHIKPIEFNIIQSTNSANATIQNDVLTATQPGMVQVEVKVTPFNGYYHTYYKTFFIN